MRNAPEHVRLVFVLILTLGDDITVVLVPDIGIMPGGDEFAFEGIGAFDQRFPLDMCIAEYAGVRGTPGQVLIHEIVDHKVPELTPDIEDVMGEAIGYRQRAGIINRVEAAAACFLG